MSYTFPHFDDIPNAHLLNFHDVNNIASYAYCETINNGFHCKGCIFQDPTQSACMVVGQETKAERLELIRYVELNHPEYLI